MCAAVCTGRVRSGVCVCVCVCVRVCVCVCVCVCVWPNGLCASGGACAWQMACAKGLVQEGVRDGTGGRGVRNALGGAGGVFLLVYRLVESIYLLCLAVSRLKGV